MMKRLAPSLLVAAFPVLTGPAAADTRINNAQRSSEIPFTAASAEQLADGTYRITWRGNSSGSIHILAATEPDGRRTARTVVVASAIDGSRIVRLTPDRRRYFILLPEHGSPLTIADHGLHLPTAPNFRDIGGYRTTDGHWVKPGLIYRSDQLDRLSDHDLAAISALKPGLLVDLRTASERKREPDRMPPQTKGLVLDVAADSRASLGGDMHEALAAIGSGQGVALLSAANREFVSLPSARSAYGTLIHRLVEGTGGPLIYHCTAGKDRTGWATAIILTLLGVPRETIMADYLASNGYLRVKNDATLTALKASGAAIDPAYLEPVLTVRPEYLQNAFDEVDRQYGSFDAYARNGLGLSSSDIATLKRRYLMGG